MAIGKSRSSKYWGLEWKDFLSLSVSLLALVLSLWNIGSQYVESGINEAKHNRQILYVAMRIGRNLANAYSEHAFQLEYKDTVPLVIAELSAIGISIKGEELSWNDASVPSDRLDFGFSKAPLLSALSQIEDLLDAYYGQSAVKLFLVGYYIHLADMALAGVADEPHANDVVCRLWNTEGARALKAIEGAYHLPHIGPGQCSNDTPAVFSAKLKEEEKLLEERLEPRASRFAAR
jgi:hypothetical protein